MSVLSLLTLNVQSPSAERARRQLDWLASRPEDVIVMTETRASDGCRLLAEAFTAAGYAVINSCPRPGEHGVLIASRLAIRPDDWKEKLGYLPSRAVSGLLPTSLGDLRLIGLYVPSRDASPEKTERKRRWLDDCDSALTGTDAHPTLLLGDLNVLEPDHQPRYGFFAAFEYDFYRSLSEKHLLIDAFRHLHPTATEHSWVGRTGDGYRYDHAFCSRSLADRLLSCDYVHEPRLTKLSDHSALTAHLAIEGVRRLVTSDPSTAASPPTLFGPAAPAPAARTTGRMPTDAPAPLGAPRLGARVLLLDDQDRVLLIHARDPDEPDHHWWELPGGGLDPGETPADTARREVAEETGILLDHLGPCLWVRETRFHYRGRQHHRREHVYLARPANVQPQVAPQRTPNEHLGLLGQRWWTVEELAATTEKLLPPALPELLHQLLAGTLTNPIELFE
ncbi:NUDIX domain-containing protein [Streptoalloteichus tenebrarius]|nr:NUDIX domain-containing protein [Streptoalloteichus tenebrarius]BFF04292.1 hypothetical protein GCM10020241_59670 [Streptoalloteichus tenebrarius]